MLKSYIFTGCINVAMKCTMTCMIMYDMFFTENVSNVVSSDVCMLISFASPNLPGVNPVPCGIFR